MTLRSAPCSRARLARLGRATSATVAAAALAGGALTSLSAQAAPAMGAGDAQDPALRYAAAMAALTPPASGAQPIATLTTPASAGKPMATSTAGWTRGIDVSRWQTTVDWAGWWSKGARFVYIKATQSGTIKDGRFAEHWRNATAAGFVRGAYHFARPDSSATARQQARHFVANGGGWQPGGATLPGALDLEETAAVKDYCYGLTPSQMVTWVRDFSDEYRKATGRNPVLYARANWWGPCTGNSTAFAATHALWTPRYSTVAPLPIPGWARWTMWQFSGTTVDQNWFAGSLSQLREFANGGPLSVNVQLAVLAAQLDPWRPKPTSTRNAASSVYAIESALAQQGLLSAREVDGRFAPATQAAYQRWQLRLGSKGGAVNGLPNVTSLTALAGDRFALTSPISVGAVVTRRGVRLNERTWAMLAKANASLGRALTVTAGSHRKGLPQDVPHTHDGGGAVDISVRGMTATQRWNAVRALRSVGFAAWLTTAGGAHIHAIAVSDPTMSAAAGRWVYRYYAGGDGTQISRPDATPKAYRGAYQWWEQVR